MIRSCSFARLPITRGMRARKTKTQQQANQMASNRNSNIGSDEENTSDYSHEPSSQHSTLESNPDVPKCLQNMRNNSDLSDSSCSDSEDPAHLSTATQLNANTTNCSQINIPIMT